MYAAAFMEHPLCARHRRDGGPWGDGEGGTRPCLQVTLGLLGICSGSCGLASQAAPGLPGFLLFLRLPSPTLTGADLPCLSRPALVRLPLQSGCPPPPATPSRLLSSRPRGRTWAFSPPVLLGVLVCLGHHKKDHRRGGLSTRVYLSRFWRLEV